MAVVEQTRSAPAAAASSASQRSNSERYAVAPLYGGEAQERLEKSTVRLCVAVVIMVARRTTQRCNGASSRHRGSTSSSTPP